MRHLVISVSGVTSSPSLLLSGKAYACIAGFRVRPDAGIPGVGRVNHDHATIRSRFDAVRQSGWQADDDTRQQGDGLPGLEGHRSPALDTEHDLVVVGMHVQRRYLTWLVAIHARHQILRVEQRLIDSRLRRIAFQVVDVDRLNVSLSGHDSWLRWMRTKPFSDGRSLSYLDQLIG